ncbi:MAG: TetR family transcriptional regulator [Lachnospiraceae bacterium]|nr:TetR family transcriptional regulator [Lachnospiraceae bacterium]
MKKRTSKQIFAETLLELSKRMPMDKITVKQIVDESGLSLQTFYNHFMDKADLVLWVHKSAFDEIMNKIGKDGYTLYDATMENIRFYYEHKDFMLNALSNTQGQESYANASADNLYQVLSRYIKEKHGLKELSKQVDFCLKMYSAVGPYAYAEWAFHMEDTAPEVFAGYLADIMPEPLKIYFSE